MEQFFVGLQGNLVNEEEDRVVWMDLKIENFIVKFDFLSLGWGLCYDLESMGSTKGNFFA